MKDLWRLLTSIFLLALGCGLFVMGYILSNGRFQDGASAVLVIVSLGCILAGTIKGIVSVCIHHRNTKDEE